MLASGKVGHGLLRVSWELGVESSKVGVAVSTRVVTAQLKLREQSMRHRGGVAKGSKVSGFSVGGGTVEAKAGVVKAAAGLCPLLVVGGQAGKRAESVPDLLVEACQRLLLQVGRYGAHAMSEFANAGAVAKETSRDLGVVELSKLVQELGGLGHFFLDVVAAESRGADGSAKELEVASSTKTLLEPSSGLVSSLLGKRLGRSALVLLLGVTSSHLPRFSWRPK